MIETTELRRINAVLVLLLLLFTGFAVADERLLIRIDKSSDLDRNALIEDGVTLVAETEDALLAVGAVAEINRAAADRSLTAEVVAKVTQDGTSFALVGLQPHQASIRREQNAQPLPVNLLPDEARKRTRSSAKHLNHTLAILSLLLLAAIITLPLVNKIQVINILESRMTIASDKVEVIHRLNDEVERLNTGSVFLYDKKMNKPLVLEIINELTRILPDDTFINRLVIKGNEIQIFGQSTTAAALIPLIESSDSLHNPRFRSSVTSSLGTDAERFHLSAEITGEQPDD